MNAHVAAHADALWRAILFTCVTALHFEDCPLSGDPDDHIAGQLKSRPSGHWGTVPGTAWILTHVGLLTKRRPDLDIVPILGAGHSGIVQISLGWLTGHLEAIDRRFTRDAAGLGALAAAFPELGGLGSEVHPALPGGLFMGGALGGALPFAQGLALAAPNRIALPILGDGECETPTTAASWLAGRALTGSRVLPIIHDNGRRMGGRSLLGEMSSDELADYANGLGWTPRIVDVAGSTEDHHAFQQALGSALEAAVGGERHVVVLRCEKGWSGPTGAHKTPYSDPRDGTRQAQAIRTWLATYRPHELFTDRAEPRASLLDALDAFDIAELDPPPPRAPPDRPELSNGDFSEQISAVIRYHAQRGDFRLFSPDELQSNRLGELAAEPWAHEVLAEEVLIAWLAGWTASGRRGLLISYEAFAPLFLVALVGQLKQRRLTDRALPSLNLLLTSYGWHNSYTHGDPSLVTAILGGGHPAAKVFTPADHARAARTLHEVLDSTGGLNIVVVGKHPTPSHPLATLNHECASGLALWPHLSDGAPADLTIVCCGDLPASLMAEAADRIRLLLSCTVRVVNVHELTVLRRDPPAPELSGAERLLFVTLGHSSVIRALLPTSLDTPFEVMGWREPPHPMSHQELATHAGLTVDGIVACARALMIRNAPRRGPGNEVSP